MNAMDVLLFAWTEIIQCENVFFGCECERWMRNGNKNKIICLGKKSINKSLANRIY